MPTLPYLIEFIESIIRTTGDFAAEHGGSQAIVNAFPPATTATVTVTPGTGIYALIAYKVGFSPAIVPGAFTGYFQHHGHTYYTGTLTATLIRDGLYWWMVITQQAPLIVGASNVSGLVQYWEEIAEYALVRYETDYEIIMEALQKLNRQSAMAEAVALLNQMKALQPRPMGVTP